MSKNKISLILMLCMLISARIVGACPACQARDSFGMCEPIASKSCIPGPPPIPNLNPLGQAILKGDTPSIKRELGKVLLNSPNCLGCRQFVSSVLPTLTPDQVNYDIGEGALVFATTGDPYVVATDVGENVANQLGLIPVPGTSPANGSTTSSSYAGEPECIVIKNNIVWAGWTDQPVLFAASGNTVKIMNVNFRLAPERFYFAPSNFEPSNKLTLVAQRLCTEWNDSSKGVKAVQKVALSYGSTKRINAGAHVIKWFITGAESP